MWRSRELAERVRVAKVPNGTYEVVSGEAMEDMSEKLSGFFVRLCGGGQVHGPEKRIGGY